MSTRLTPGFKNLMRIVAIVVVIVALFFGAKFGLGKMGSSKSSNVGDGTLSSQEKSEVIKVGVVGFSGYSPLYYMNVDPATGRADKANKNSRAYKEFGLLIEIIEMNDPSTSIEAWKSNNVNVHWWTADSFAPMAEQLSRYNPKIFMAVDKSRGADVCVVKPGISNIQALRGKEIAYQPNSPSQTFLQWMLASSGMTLQDIVSRETASAEEAATLFKSSAQINACITWSPYDLSCISGIPGSSALCTSEQAPDLIADVMFAKEEYLVANQDKMQKFVDCWLSGSAELNSTESLRDQAANILFKSSPTQQSISDWRSSIDKLRFCTKGDNEEFFGLQQNQSKLTGEQIYNATVISGTRTPWSSIAYSQFIKFSALSGLTHAAETTTQFTRATNADLNRDAMSTRQVNINFAFGSASLSSEARSIIDSQIVNLARAFSNMRLQVEGNTDNIGDYSGNISLSRRRAQAVVDYLVQQYNFDVNRFIVIGNGPNNPVADNGTESGRAQNRRTEFKLK